jgi:hypothetical protein
MRILTQSEVRRSYPTGKILTQTYKYIAIKKKKSSLRLVHFLGRNPKISQSIRDQFRETFSKLAERNKYTATGRRIQTSASGESAQNQNPLRDSPWSVACSDPH